MSELEFGEPGVKAILGHELLMPTHGDDAAGV
jgi:hypothetical protein